MSLPLVCQESLSNESNLEHLGYGRLVHLSVESHFPTRPMSADKSESDRFVILTLGFHALVSKLRYA